MMHYNSATEQQRQSFCQISAQHVA